MTGKPFPFPYRGPEALRRPIHDALRRVLDPEVAINIVDVGLVYGVAVTDTELQGLLTMTSAACPLAGLIVEDIETELERDLPPGLSIKIDLVWEPPWTNERMSDSAKRRMGW